MKQERQRLMKELLQERKSITNHELCAHFGVSIETIRRDLADLERNGLVRCVYGGAVLRDTYSEPNRIPPWDTRFSDNQPEKQALANEALRWITDGTTIALDSGTTILNIAAFLGQKKHLTIILNDMRIAMELSANTEHKIFFIGGCLDRGDLITTGFLSLDFLNNFSHIDLVVFSADGFSDATGLSDHNIEMGVLKSALISRANKVMAVFDHNKFSSSCLYKVCSADQIDTLITGDQAPRKIVENLRQRGTNVVLVPTGDSSQRV